MREELPLLLALGHLLFSQLIARSILAPRDTMAQATTVFPDCV